MTIQPTFMNELTDKQLAAIIAKVKKWTGRTVSADAIERVRGGEWTKSHPVDRAILSALDEVAK